MDYKLRFFLNKSKCCNYIIPIRGKPFTPIPRKKEILHFNNEFEGSYKVTSVEYNYPIDSQDYMIIDINAESVCEEDIV